MIPMEAKRVYHGMTSISDTIFVSGGRDTSNNEWKTCENLENGKWSDKKEKSNELMEYIYIYIYIYNTME